MTSLEIVNAARPLSPRLQLRDVWHLMRQFEQEGLAACLNPQEKTGRLYHLTDFGREVVRSELGIEIDPPAPDLDWTAYARIARAKARRSVLQELGQPRWDGTVGIAAAVLRKRLTDKYPLGLNPTIRALQELCADSLGEVVGTTKKRKQKLYRITKLGEKVLAQIGK